MPLWERIDEMIFYDGLYRVKKSTPLKVTVIRSKISDIVILHYGKIYGIIGEKHKLLFEVRA